MHGAFDGCSRCEAAGGKSRVCRAWKELASCLRQHCPESQENLYMEAEQIGDTNAS